MAIVEKKKRRHFPHIFIYLSLCGGAKNKEIILSTVFVDLVINSK